MNFLDNELKTYSMMLTQMVFEDIGNWQNLAGNMQEILLET
jgi:hypothetical protein